ncbi:MAG TPA: fumarylacetoacetate hydrolase family protein [Anaerolineales bacterium]|nr:fumarylacetoacetate hydrolase family protein [Anaerolineales bacterium]
MQLVTYSAYAKSHQPGLLVGDAIYPLPFASMLDLLEAGAKGLERARRAAEGKRVELADATLHSPILRPTTLRDAYAFETHVKTANANRGRDVPEEWYKFPVFYFTNPSNVFGPEDEIPYPAFTQEMDYELEIAAVIGKPGRNIKAAEAPKHIVGFTIFNDWSARDVQRDEMKVGLGPGKGKDFASSLGPCIVTLDELAERSTERPGVFDMEMRARINGKERSHGNFKDIYWTFGDILERISQSVTLMPGDVIGSGTVGTGCLLELTKAKGPWLQPGDVVELEIEGIGTLKNTVGARDA